MPGWLLNIAYAGLLLAVSPLVLWRALRHGRYRRGWREKLLGSLPPRTDPHRPLLWLHAVSVGEVLLLQPLLQRLRATRPDLQFMLTTSTDAGYDVARERLTDCRVTWLPLDFTWAVRRAVQRVQPDLLILVELELWPNLIRAASETGVPLMLVNARLSERSWRGYRRVRRLIAPLLQRFDHIAGQTAEYADRLIDLGADPRRVSVTGSIKFDGVQTDRSHPSIQTLRQALGIAEAAPVFIAGSTQAPEEAAALDAWMVARQTHPGLRLVLAPRHRERFDEVAALVESRGLPLFRRSTGQTTGTEASTTPPVLLVDTIGELVHVWGLADVAYVGGSLTPGRGGQNMLEPAAYGAAVLFGPHTTNFRAAVESLRAKAAAIVVANAAELTEQLVRLLDSPTERQALGQRAREVVLAQQGATERTVAALLKLLSGAGGAERRAA